VVLCCVGGVVAVNNCYRMFHSRAEVLREKAAAAAAPTAAAAAKPAEKKKEEPPKGVSYKQLTVGCPKETYRNERRVALTPENVKNMLKKGFKAVFVEKGAGAGASFSDEAYAAAGATLVDNAQGAFAADIVLKVRAPGDLPNGGHEADLVRAGSTLISFIQPAQNAELVKKLATRKANVFAMDCVPRISRAQVFDALSSMYGLTCRHACPLFRLLWSDSCVRVMIDN
jgi:H+-translocating NAD(P) transhydrogenase